MRCIINIALTTGVTAVKEKDKTKQSNKRKQLLKHLTKLIFTRRLSYFEKA